MEEGLKICGTMGNRTTTTGRGRAVDHRHRKIKVSVGEFPKRTTLTGLQDVSEVYPMNLMRYRRIMLSQRSRAKETAERIVGLCLWKI